MHLRELDANLIVILDALLLEASVTKAAERLGRSPSAVSHALARLRDVFSDPLFVRAGQRLVPTSRATQLAPTVHVIVAGLEGLLNNETAFEPQAQQRSFALACRGDLELSLLPALRAALAERAPGLSLERRDEACVVEGLRAGRVELAIVEGGAPSANDISAKRLFDEPFAAFSAATSETRGGTGEPLVFAAAAHERHICAAMEPSRPMRLETVASPLVALHAALARRGMALVPESVGALAMQYMPLRRIATDPGLPPLPHHLMWHLSMERDACHAWFRDQLRRCAEKLGVARPEPAPVEHA